MIAPMLGLNTIGDIPTDEDGVPVSNAEAIRRIVEEVASPSRRP